MKEKKIIIKNMCKTCGCEPNINEVIKEQEIFQIDIPVESPMRQFCDCGCDDECVDCDCDDDCDCKDCDDDCNC